MIFTIKNRQASTVDEKSFDEVPFARESTDNYTVSIVEMVDFIFQNI